MNCLIVLLFLNKAKQNVKNSNMDIVCRKYSCKFNEKAKCTRKNLEVNSKSDCNDLQIDNTKVVEDVSRDMFTHEPDVAPYHHCKNINISCKTEKCVFNKNGECFSNGILVGSTQKSAPCNSYSPR